MYVPVTIALVHPRVNKEAGEAELGNFASQQFDSLGRVAEDDSLGDVQLAEERVQAVQLLPLFQVGIVLRQPLQGQFFGEAQQGCIRHVFPMEVANRYGVRG